MSHQLFEDEEQTNKYRLFRPGYPTQLFDHIRKYYFVGMETNEKIPLAVDVGCGSGQATSELSSFCARVIGIDISANQIAHAIRKDNIEYRCHKGEDLTFLQSNSVDLLTIATTLHWLDIESFFAEVERVLKPHRGVFAIWTYGPGALDNPKADAVYHEFDQITLFPYWNSKRWLVDDYYQSLLPLFPFKSSLMDYTIGERETTLEQFLGLVESFSACQTFRKQEGEKAYRDLLTNFRGKLMACYRKESHRNANDDDTLDGNSIEFLHSNSIRLYLMKKP